MFTLVKVRLIDALVRNYISQEVYDDYIQKGIKNNNLIEVPFPVVPRTDYVQIPITNLQSGMNVLVTPNSGKSLRVVRIYFWSYKEYTSTKENSRVKLYMGDRPQSGDLPVEINPFNIDFLWWPMAGAPDEALKIHLYEGIANVEGFLVYYEV